jgi:xanthine dehydrogenase accessory factor
MYEIALTVDACLRAGTRVDVAWAVETDGFGSRDRSEAVALTPGGGRVGSLLSGSLDDQLADVAALGSAGGRLVHLSVADIEAMAAGLPSGGDARCLVVPAGELPTDLWTHLLDRQPVCLVTRLAGGDVMETTLFTSASVADAGEEARRLFGRATSDAVIVDDTVVTVLWPVPRAVIVGAGAIAAALEQAAALLGWHTQTATDVATATGLVAGLAPLDKLVVLSPDLDLVGPVLAAALDTEVGYIGAVGSRRTQQARADWLAYRGVTDLSRVHGPAGLDIGASTPPEIAISVLAEALATRAGATGRSLSKGIGTPGAEPAG